ncbi:hypothetical protein C2G38_2163157 [Gigaspora rosea]|uniref:Uncharacterized protein n=1 Tax=Gigaspora rosea TaxID=44941 RepID=A0A397VVA8_9GLOM|nr:hypothetical protein C2G38_2163157 [Gigaspora rosea]
MTNKRVEYEYLTSGEGSNSWSYSKFAESKGASDGQNQQSSLASRSFQELNPLYNNQCFIEPSYGGLDNEELQLINESYSEINNYDEITNYDAINAYFEINDDYDEIND